MVSASANTIEILERAGLTHLIDERVDAHTIDSEHLAPKPAPDTLIAACRMLCVDPSEIADFETLALGYAPLGRPESGSSSPSSGREQPTGSRLPTRTWSSTTWHSCSSVSARRAPVRHKPRGKHGLASQRAHQPGWRTGGLVWRMSSRWGVARGVCSWRILVVDRAGRRCGVAAAVPRAAGHRWRWGRSTSGRAGCEARARPGGWRVGRTARGRCEARVRGRRGAQAPSRGGPDASPGEDERIARTRPAGIGDGVAKRGGRSSSRRFGAQLAQAIVDELARVAARSRHDSRVDQLIGGLPRAAAGERDDADLHSSRSNRETGDEDSKPSGARPDRHEPQADRG